MPWGGYGIIKGLLMSGDYLGPQFWGVSFVSDTENQVK